MSTIFWDVTLIRTKFPIDLCHVILCVGDICDDGEKKEKIYLKTFFLACVQNKEKVFVSPII